MKNCNVLHDSSRSFTRSVRGSCRRHVLHGRRLPLRIKLCCGRHANTRLRCSISQPKSVTFCTIQGVQAFTARQAQCRQLATSCPPNYRPFPPCAPTATSLLLCACMQHQTAPAFLLMPLACIGPRPQPSSLCRWLVLAHGSHERCGRRDHGFMHQLPHP